MRPALACCLGAVTVLSIGGAYLTLLGEITSKCGPRGLRVNAADSAAPPNNRKSSSLQFSAAGTSSIAPLSCSDILQGPLATSDPNKGTVHGKKTITDPSFTIALHNETIDHTRWAIMKYGFYYERFITDRAVEIMGPNSTAPGIFLDVGMNVGWFSLLAAALGRDVVAFEPNPINYFRMCQSVGLNGWSSPGYDGASRPDIRVFPYGAGAKPTNLTLVQPPNNPGGGSFQGDAAPVNLANGVIINDIRVVTLDDVAKELRWYDEPKTQIAILRRGGIRPGGL